MSVVLELTKKQQIILHVNRALQTLRENRDKIAKSKLAPPIAGLRCEGVQEVTTFVVSLSAQSLGAQSLFTEILVANNNQRIRGGRVGIDPAEFRIELLSQLPVVSRLTSQVLPISSGEFDAAIKLCELLAKVLPDVSDEYFV